MSTDPLADSALKARLDTPDFQEALAADTDGSFYQDAVSYLGAWRQRIRQYQDAGVSTGEFASLTQLSASIDSAERVIEFFVKLQKLAPMQ